MKPFTLLALVCSLLLVSPLCGAQDLPRRRVEVQDATVGAALRLIGEAFDLPLAVGPLPDTRVSLRLPRVNADEALEALARAAGLQVIRRDGVIGLGPKLAPSATAGAREGQEPARPDEPVVRRVVVGPFVEDVDRILESVRGQGLKVNRPYERIVVFEGPERLVGPAAELVKGLKAQAQPHGAESELFRLGLADGEQALASIQAMLEGGERAAYDPTAHALTVTASPERLERVRAWLADYDREVPQIEIEARVVEVRSDALERLGAKWNVELGLKGGSVPSSFPLRGVDDAQPFLPSPNQAGFDPSFVFSRLDASKFSVVLQALRTDGEAKVVASPRLTALQNRSAQLELLTTLRVPTFTRNDAFATETVSGIETVEYGTSLEVRPRLGRLGQISLLVTPEVSELEGFQEGLPIVTRRRTHTEVVLAHGETLVISGLNRTREVEQVDSVPVLGQVPVLGRMFQHKQQTKERTELVVFLTPRRQPSAQVRARSKQVGSRWLPRALGETLETLRADLASADPARRALALQVALETDAELLAQDVDLTREVLEQARDPERDVRLAAARFVLWRRPGRALRDLATFERGAELAVALLAEPLAPHLRHGLARQLAASPSGLRELTRRAEAARGLELGRLLEALVAADPRRAASLARQRLDAPRVTERAAACAALARCGSPADAARLRACARASQHPEVRLRAADAALRVSSGRAAGSREALAAWTQEAAGEPLGADVPQLAEALRRLRQARPDFHHFVCQALRAVVRGPRSELGDDARLLVLAPGPLPPERLAHRLVHWARRAFAARVLGEAGPCVRADALRLELEVLGELVGTPCDAARVDDTLDRALRERSGE